MHKKCEVNQTKIKGGCQSERKAAEMISYGKMPIGTNIVFEKLKQVLSNFECGLN